MHHGQCVKCSSAEVYYSDAKGIQHGLTDAPGLRIYKDQKWVPDVMVLEFAHYVCQACGYFEMYVRDVAKLAALGTSSNWRRVGSPAPLP